MQYLELTDLYNPSATRAVLLTSGVFIEAGPDQGWQEYPGSWELWQKLLPPDNRLLRVRRWLKKSVVATYGNATPTVAPAAGLSTG